MPAFNTAKVDLFFSPYNGSSAWTEVGKFIHDNTTNGGAAGVLTATTIDLLNAQGRTSPASARYGVEYFIVERTAGAATAVPHPVSTGNYLSGTMLDAVQGVFNADSAATFAGWLRAIDGTALVVGVNSAARIVYLNGVRVALPANAGVNITPAMGWVHIRCVTRTTFGYENAFPNIYAEPNQKFQLALPAFMFGEADPGLHIAPIQTINELIP
ncbi:hypothetical protein D3C71_1387620 [compost metagenome]